MTLSTQERRLAILERLAQHAAIHADHDRELSQIYRELSKAALQDAVAETDKIIKTESFKPPDGHKERLQQLITATVEATRRRAGLTRAEAAGVLGLSSVAAYSKRECGQKDITLLEFCLLREKLTPEHRPMSPIPMGKRSYQD